MKNFEEIAEKCLAGELSGIFIFNTGAKLHSQYLKKNHFRDYFYLHKFVINKEGHLITKDVESEEIIDFIPDNMQEQIKIDIPEGKVPIMEQTKNGVVITWKEKELTYTELLNEFRNNLNCIHVNLINSSSQAFHKKVEVLRKLTNIRNYFGKPSGTESGFYVYKFNENEFKVATTGYPAIYANDVVAFAKKEHAEQAIKMLGDELKYLFEPW